MMLMSTDTFAAGTWFTVTVTVNWWSLSMMFVASGGLIEQLGVWDGVGDGIGVGVAVGKMVRVEVAVPVTVPVGVVLLVGLGVEVVVAVALGVGVKGGSANRSMSKKGSYGGCTQDDTDGLINSLRTTLFTGCGYTATFVSVVNAVHVAGFPPGIPKPKTRLVSVLCSSGRAVPVGGPATTKVEVYAEKCADPG